MKISRAFKLPWSSPKDHTKAVFRALGLGLLISGFRSLQHSAVGKGYEEPTKIAIRGNRTTASLRTLIHFIPVGVALWEVVINWNTYYLGKPYLVLHFISLVQRSTK